MSHSPIPDSHLIANYAASFIKGICLAVLVATCLMSQNAYADWTWVGGSDLEYDNAIYGPKGEASTSFHPGSRYSGATWTDLEGNLWLFGGVFLEETPPWKIKNDMWKYTPSTQTWTWVTGSNLANQYGVYWSSKGTPDERNAPGAREYATTWTDASGNFYMFGGNGLGESYRESEIIYLNDLWKYNPQTNMWTWLSGFARGGDPGLYGTKGEPGALNRPGARIAATGWTDSNGDLWLFGGHGEQLYNDLWKFTVSTGMWTWMSGIVPGGNLYGVYGTLGQPSNSNRPGAREHATGWVDANDNLWLFGGKGYNSSVGETYLNDLWRFNAAAGASGQWTWVGGPSEGQPLGSYGSKGQTSPDNQPGGRYGHVVWGDRSGNFWLFGGLGWNDSGSGFLSDLWKFNPGLGTNGEWTWMDGPKVRGANGVYGTKGQSAPDNTPGARFSPSGWTLPNNTLWLYGGSGWSRRTTGDLSDFWMYEINNSNIKNWKEFH